MFWWINWNDLRFQFVNCCYVTSSDCCPVYYLCACFPCITQQQKLSAYNNTILFVWTTSTTMMMYLLLNVWLNNALSSLHTTHMSLWTILHVYIHRYYNSKVILSQFQKLKTTNRKWVNVCWYNECLSH